MEMRLIAGKHKGGKLLDTKIISFEVDDKEILGWIVYGICKKCNIVIILHIFIEPEQPIQDVDFTITDKIAEEGGFKGEKFEEFIKGDETNDRR